MKTGSCRWKMPGAKLRLGANTITRDVPCCTGLDDAVRISREICRLLEYAARLRPDITDYEWMTYGEQVI